MSGVFNQGAQGAVVVLPDHANDAAQGGAEGG